MARLTRQLRARLTLVGYFLGAAVLLFLMPARLTAPARTVFTQAAGPIEALAYGAGGDAVAAATTLREALLDRERDRLLAREVLRLRNENAELREALRRERMRSRGTGISLSGPFKAIGASVTSYDSSPMRRSITIAAGTRKGVRKGVAVVAMGAVVGTVVEAGQWLSRVRLITDAESLAPCRVSRTRDVCVLKGTGGPVCRVELIQKDASVKPGDVLVTAPQEELLERRPLMPPGLPVATILRVEPSRTDPLFLEVKAAPRVNVERLEVVEVIVPVEPAEGT